MAISNGWRLWPTTAIPARANRSPKIKPAGDPLATAARQAARSVVSIQTVGQANTRILGAGFVVGDGLVVTNFHVLSSATEGQVRFSDGRVFAIAGYAAASPDRDLALLRLIDPPTDVVPLSLVGQDIEVASQVMAIGHPRGVEFAFVEGRISQRVKTAELPTDSQRFIRNLTGGNDALRWLQHTAALSEGNSGGPLIDDQGRVVGINTWINRQSNINYALDASYLAELLGEASDDTQPLETLARADVQASLVVSRLTAKRLQTLWDSAETMHWLPASKSDYRQLSELALAMTTAHLPQTFQGDKFDQARAAELQVAVTQMEEALKAKKPFGTPDQVTIVNEQAASMLATPHAGLFCFAEVERVVEGDNGRRAMIMQLIGTEQTFLVSLDGQFLTPQPKENYAVFGVNLNGEVVRYGDNPLKLKTAPVIISRTLIPIAH
jgi:hypothetical protein